MIYNNNLFTIQVCVDERKVISISKPLHKQTFEKEADFKMYEYTTNFFQPFYPAANLE